MPLYPKLGERPDERFLEIRNKATNIANTTLPISSTSEDQLMFLIKFIII